jgi:two-component system, response regulator FlrC
MQFLIVGELSGHLAPAIRAAIGRGARVDNAQDIEQGVNFLRKNSQVSLALLSVELDIRRFTKFLAAENMDIPVIAYGVGASPDRAAQAIRDGAQEYLSLPPDFELMAEILEGRRGDDHCMVARDPATLALLQRADQVAGADAAVLISGESGTGKEVLARRLHRKSRRANGPFVALNCAAIPDNLLESELFGHEKGAFSGAVERRIGKFEAADGGTLLLDEISEMDIRLQAKLLRAVQEREIDRLGGKQPIKINVRIISTTNRNLLGCISSGSFREDLYFRLNVISLKLPALRERLEDIAPLAEYFARRYSKLNGVDYRPINAAALACLRANPWRGNIRELENTIHRAVLLAHGDEIGPDVFEQHGAKSDVIEGQASDRRPEAATHFVGRKMEDVEKELIIGTLQHTFGNRTHAAVLLGISIRTLRNKLKEYAAKGVAVPQPLTGAAV